MHITFEIKRLIILSVTAIIIEKGLLSDIIYFLERIRGVYLSIYKFMRLRFSKL
jgi:hypothetical protein